jgi:hypothetical protein
MKILVACEFSGKVRDAFIAKGHDAVSCDIIPSESPGPHIQDDVLKHLDDGWDLMIAHPPCTYLANSGVCWLYKQPERMKKMIDARNFFLKFCDANIPKICIENPIPHKYFFADIFVPRYDQIIQPWMFGHTEQKATCLWLKGLPKLYPTSTNFECQNNRIYAKMMKLPKRERERLHYLPPSEERQKLRSTTYPGIATAMAEQWG